MHWRVLLSPKLWDQKAYAALWNMNPEERILYQSKGGRTMKACPQEGDHISFVYQGFVVMRGVALSNGFERGVAHKNHSCNKGSERKHAEHPEYARINITELCRGGEKVRRTGQATWARVCL